jgi:hypothetical protein
MLSRTLLTMSQRQWSDASEEQETCHSGARESANPESTLSALHVMDPGFAR